ncbi:MAG: hypothetical protein LBP53_00795 [Candidatus Peribacteria bacterium]|jgi:hypothetical protein|nr:hypothetical protein [Candidatus Peribacteria bacterium]
MNNGVKMLGEYVYIRTTYQQFATFGNLLPHDDSTTKTIIFPYHIATDMVGERIEIPAMLFVPFDMQGGILIGKKFECFECDGNVAPDVILYNPAYTVLANIGYVKEVKIHPKEENGEYAYISYEPFNITYKACPDKDLCEVETIYTPSGVRQSYVNPYLWGMDI